jgi:hypothetical protein
MTTVVESDKFCFFVPNSLCNSCIKHPSFFSNEKCILCIRSNNIDYENSPFFNDEYQLKIRKFLEITNGDYILLGYTIYSDRMIFEGWLCTICNKILIFELLYPSITRNKLHFLTRLDHMKNCHD